MLEFRSLPQESRSAIGTKHSSIQSYKQFKQKFEFLKFFRLFAKIFKQINHFKNTQKDWKKKQVQIIPLLKQQNNYEYKFHPSNTVNHRSKANESHQDWQQKTWNTAEAEPVEAEEEAYPTVVEEATSEADKMVVEAVEEVEPSSSMAAAAVAGRIETVVVAELDRVGGAWEAEQRRRMVDAYCLI